MPHRRFGVLRLERFFNDKVWRPAKGYSARDGTWRFVGAGALAFGLFGVGAVIMGGAHVPDQDAILATRVSSHASRLGWKESDTTTTVPPAPQPKPEATGSPPPARVRGSGRAGGGCRSLDQIGADESHNDYGAVNPSSGAGGRYQILPSTWRANGGSGLPQNASPAEQDRIAQKIYAEQGSRPWRASGC